MRLASFFLVASFLAACSTSSDGPGDPVPPGDDAGGGPPPEREVAILPPLSEAVKSTEIETLIPSHPIDAELRMPHSMTPEVRERQLAEGYAEVTFGPGEAQIEETADGNRRPTAPAGPQAPPAVRAPVRLPARRRVPSRLAVFDGVEPFESAARPQEGISAAW